ncbi:MAG: hypothetical protein QXH91_01435, partial [Candidatus Bathyarchaeia archaeon]
MKIYLSWSPTPPDPSYWNWLPLDGIMISIATLKKKGLLDKTILIGLHDYLGFRGEIFLDSGSYEEAICKKKLTPNTPRELLSIAEWLRVDKVAHLDTPFIGERLKLPEKEKWRLLHQNILNARITNEASKQFKPKVEVIYVIQGWSDESLAYCAEELASLDVKYYALGSLFGLRPNEIEARVKLVREIIGESPKLHLFAVSSPNVIKRVGHLVDSVDSSTASVSGAMKELFLPSGRKHVDKIAEENLKCDCPVCSKHKGAIIMMGKQGTRSHYDRLRKIHNAY